MSSMRNGAIIICIFLASTSVSRADLNFDLACAVTSAAEIATTEDKTTERQTALLVNYYFLGRRGFPYSF